MTLSKYSPKLKRLMVRMITNFIDLMLLLQYKDLIVLVEHDSLPFLPSVKSSAFGVFMLFGIMENFVIFWRTCCAKIE